MWNPFSRAKESILRASDAERHDAIEGLVTGTTMRRGYYFLLMFSVVIVTTGQLVENAPIVIGGMVIAPLLTPILLLAVSAVSRSVHGAARAMVALAMSVLLSFALASGIAWIVAAATTVPTLAPSSIHPLLYLVVALCSGAVASIAWVKKELASAIAGIAISVSLLPPLCAAGIGFAHGQYAAMVAALAVFGTNVLGILGAAIATFIVLGFARFGSVTEDSVAREGRAAA